MENAQKCCLGECQSTNRKKCYDLGCETDNRIWQVKQDWRLQIVQLCHLSFFFINIATFSGEFIRFGEQCLDLSFLFLMEWSRYEEAFWGYAQLCNSTDPCNFTEEKGGINEKGDHRWNNAFKIFSNEKFLPVGKTSMLMPA